MVVESRIVEREAISWIEDLGRNTGAFEILGPESREEDLGFDACLRLHPQSGRAELKLFIEARALASAVDVLDVSKRFLSLRMKGVPLLCAGAISPRVAEFCIDMGVSYLDAAGNCHIAARGLFLHVEGRKNRHRVPRKAVDIFAPKSSRVVRVLLSNPARGWQVQELAQECQVSIGLVSRIKNGLVNEAFAELRKGLLFVRDPRGLFEAWTAVNKAPERRAFYVMDEPNGIERRIAEWSALHNVRYALTGFSGAWRSAPVVRSGSVNVYVETRGERQSADLLQHLAVKPVETGANLFLWSPPDEYTFYGSRDIDGVTVVAPLQLYLDLTGIPGRGEEAAAEVLQAEILPSWKRATTQP